MSCCSTYRKQDSREARLLRLREVAGQRDYFPLGVASHLLDQIRPSRVDLNPSGLGLNLEEQCLVVGPQEGVPTSRGG